MKSGFIHKIVLLLVLSSLYGCKEIVLHQSKTFSSVKVDGILSEWDTVDFLSHNNNQLKLGCSKDIDYIYIAGITTDKDITRQTISNGITVWIDPSGNKRKNLEMEVKLPQSKRIEYFKGGFFSSLSKEQRKFVLQRIDSLKQGIVVIDNKSDKSINFSVEANSLFTGKIYSSHDTLMFEIKIPIALNEVFPSVKSITDETIFGISSSMNVNVFQEHQGPFTVMNEGMDSNRRNWNGTSRSPANLEVWFKIGGSGK